MNRICAKTVYSTPRSVQLKSVKWVISCLVSFFLTGAASEAQELKGPAAAAIRQKLGGDAKRILVSEVFYGDFSGDGLDDAFARIFLNFEGGNSFYIRNMIFLNDAGKYGFISEAEKPYGQEASKVRFSKGRITLQTKVSGPNDARCCPTKVEKWTINVPLGETGVAAPTAGGKTGTLGKRWCGQGMEAVEFSRDGGLFIHAGKSISTFDGVTFEGCTGMTCTYVKKDGGYVWKSHRNGSFVSVTGPMYVGSKLVLATAEFGSCPK